MSPADGIVAEVVRSNFVESVHRGRVLGVAADGTAVVEVGDVVDPVFPRSALKPLQTAAMLRLGWDPDDDEQVALACASHSGEAVHVTVVRRILSTAGLDEAALDNTPDLPLNADAGRDLLRGGGGPDPLHQNCSGKHAAMLATCVARGWPLDGYRDADHRLQRGIRDLVEDLTGEEVAAVGVDGCGAPQLAVSLVGLVRAFRSVASAAPGSAERRVADAIRAHPLLVGGTGRDVTALIGAVEGIIAKDGAEGVYAAALPDGRAVALKISDGASRARPPVMVAALRRLGVDAAGFEILSAPPVLGHGEPVGAVRAVL